MDVQVINSNLYKIQETNVSKREQLKEHANFSR